MPEGTGDYHACTGCHRDHLTPREASLNVVLFGATGMVGAGALIECLEDARVASVLVVGRSSCGVTHPKLREVIRSDFFDFSDAGGDFAALEACFFCLGVSAAGMAEAQYHRLTYDLTMAAARALAEVNPAMTFIYVSGQGTDSSERGRFMWARVKGKTENHLLALPFSAFMFRPGFIRPLKGVTSRFLSYRIAYGLADPLYPLLERFVPGVVTTTVNVGQAMINVAERGYAKRVLENPDINRAARL